MTWVETGFHRQPLDRGGDHAQDREEHRVAVARDDLGGDRLRLEAQLAGDMLLHLGRDVGEGADRAGNRAGGDLVARGEEAGAAAVELGIGLGELEPEAGRLGVDPVAAANGRGELVLDRAPLQHREQRVEVGEQQFRRLLELHRQRGVEHVGAGHPLVQVTRLRPHLAAGPGQEGDHVMLGDRFDLIDRGDVDLAEHIGVISRADPAGVLRRDHPDPPHRLGREHLDREPDAVAVFRRPDRRHLGAGVAGDHIGPCLLKLEARLARPAASGKPAGRRSAPMERNQAGKPPLFKPARFRAGWQARYARLRQENLTDCWRPDRSPRPVLHPS